jgi:hypothetical protein
MSDAPLETSSGSAANTTAPHVSRAVIARETGDRHGEGNALFDMSLALDALGQPADAIAQAEAALEIYQQMPSAHPIGACHSRARPS